MRRPLQFSCDVCELQQNGSSDGWLVVSLGDIGADTDEWGFHCQPWNEKAAVAVIRFERRHVCGQRCALVMFGWWLETKTLDKPISPRTEPVKTLEAKA